MGIDMKNTRPYTMTTRAEATERTRNRIMDAALALSTEKPLAAISLPDIARLAEVSVQTVLRQFESRDGVLDATIDFARAAVTAERRTTPGDVPTAIRVLVDHYERRGDGVLLLLGQETWEARAATVTEGGRRLHREWVTEVFAPILAHAPADGRDELVDLLVVATDVYTWKLLRRDRRLSRSDTVSRMLLLVESVLKGNHDVTDPLRHH
jgi:AcrR family transcriptional regulator